MIKLPIETSPYVQCYHNMAFPLSVIQGNAKTLGKDILPWAIGKYLNCVFDHVIGDSRFALCGQDLWGVGEGILKNQYLSVDRTLYNKLGIDILKSIKTILDDGNYIYGMYNEKYIPGKYAYNRYDYDHDYLLYGYDDNRRVMYSIGYLTNKKYASFEISYENYINSIVNSSNPQSEINIFKYNPDHEFKTDMERIIEGIRDYIQSSSTWNKSTEFSYGATAVKNLRDYLQASAFKFRVPHIDDRYTRAHSEHKYLLMRCANYLRDVKKVDFHDKDIKMIEEMYQKSKMIHMLVIKFNMSPSSELLNSIVDGFDFILNHGHEAINNIYNSLRYQ